MCLQTYIHRYEAYSINRAALNGHTPCRTTALPNPEGHLIQEVKWCQLDDGEFYLVMCMESGVIVRVLHAIFVFGKKSSETTIFDADS